MSTSPAKHGILRRHAKQRNGVRSRISTNSQRSSSSQLNTTKELKSKSNSLVVMTGACGNSGNVEKGWLDASGKHNAKCLCLDCRARREAQWARNEIPEIPAKDWLRSERSEISTISTEESTGQKLREGAA